MDAFVRYAFLPALLLVSALVLRREVPKLFRELREPPVWR